MRVTTSRVKPPSAPSPTASTATSRPHSRRLAETALLRATPNLGGTKPGTVVRVPEAPELTVKDPHASSDPTGDFLKDQAARPRSTRSGWPARRPPRGRTSSIRAPC